MTLKEKLMILILGKKWRLNHLQIVLSEHAELSQVSSVKNEIVLGVFKSTHNSVFVKCTKTVNFP